MNETHPSNAIVLGNGRELFVDDYLVEKMDGIVRYWNSPVKLESPLIRPTADDGTRVGGCAVATDGGLWWDPTVRRFRLWYEDNWAGNMRYAESADGLHWIFPDLGRVPGTNRVFTDQEEPCGVTLDSWSVWPDYQSANPYAVWRAFATAPWVGQRPPYAYFLRSADGRRFENLGIAGYPGDRSTMHYDALLHKWVLSLRDSHFNDSRSRAVFLQDEPVPGIKPVCCCGNRSGLPDSEVVAAEPWTELDIDYGPCCQLYNFDAVPYESLMLGVMEVLHNTPRDNLDSEEAGLPKQTALRFAFSRDGRIYQAAPDEALKPSGWGSGKWDTGYLSATGGICVIKDEKLWFFYSALRGDVEMRRAIVGGNQPMYRQGLYYNGAIGAATLRRDGFCGLVADGKGSVLTKPLSFTGGHLFVNAECLFGEVTAAVIDAEGKPFSGFSEEDCTGLTFVDRTKAELLFRGGTLEHLGTRGPRIRFSLHCATLYSFWLSSTARGESCGYVAAGGPDYPCGLKDDVSSS